jgi:hypothetical protein
LEDTILRDSDNVPMEAVEYYYRKAFNLSNAEMMAEPYDKMMVNLEIMKLENLRSKIDSKEAERNIRKK